MNPDYFLKSINLSELNTHTPKYIQIIDAIIHGVRSKSIHNDQELPSINFMSKELKISRSTVLKAYNILCEKGIILSAQGKGFKICTANFQTGINAFIMLDGLNEYKTALYNGIKDGIAERTNSTGKIDFYFHHYNPEHFVGFLESNLGRYEYYAVIPFTNKTVRDALAKFDQSKLLIVDVNPEYSKGAATIYESHNQELTKALALGASKIKKYKKFHLIFPNGFHIPEEVKKGFTRFCKEYEIDYTIINCLKDKDIKKESAYLVMEDCDLVTLFEVAREKKLIAGKDIGVISYDNTPLKRIIEGGVSVISIDFYKMGQLVAEQIVERNMNSVLMPTELILRNTL